MKTELPLLSLPSPVRQLAIESDNELWLKDDSMICELYGGNKPRKLVHLLGDALRRGARRIVTVGALGSHHVLATGLLARHVGLSTLAIALPRRRCPHAEWTAIETLRAGVELMPLGTVLDLPRVMSRIKHSNDYFIAPGGSSPLGALGYLEAIAELKGQISAGLLPEPDVIVVALGSGGTAAGILAGLVTEQLRSHLVAVPVLHVPAAATLVRLLATAVGKRGGAPLQSDFSSRLTIDTRWTGDGYGCPIAAGELAMDTAAGVGLTLETTYTAKSFACALDWLRGPQGRGNVRVRPGRRTDDQSQSEPRGCKRILFWSTFSAVSLATTQGCAVTLPPALTRLFRPN